jgi:hypothetical protein
VFLIAVVAILIAHDGRGIPHLKYGITINALASTSATISTFLLMVPIGAGMGRLKWIWFQRYARPLRDFDAIDAASRDPMGSPALLLLRRGV